MSNIHYLKMPQSKKYTGLKRVITIGNFDGFHLGHNRLMKETRALADEIRKKSVSHSRPDGKGGATRISTMCITFERLFAIARGRILTPLDEKIELISHCGFIDEILVLPDAKYIWQMSAEDFVQKIILPQNPVGIVAGYDFRFGRGAQGDTTLLKKIFAEKTGGDVAVKVLPPVALKKAAMRAVKNKIISSSAIRDLISKGDVSAARLMLGRFYSAKGEKTEGAGIAGRLGFPTINLKTDTDKLLPANGVYGAFAVPCYGTRAADCHDDDGGGIVDRNNHVFKAAVYIGSSPTLFIDGKRRLEFHLIGCDGKENFLKKIKFWEVYFIKKIRGEKKFASQHFLKKQIKKDIMKIRLLSS